MLQHFPRVRLTHLPTPLEPLDRLSEHLGGPRIWVKRDDCTGLATGGNKARKLEFLMADAADEGADAIVTAGAEQSNHVRQTAAAAARLGLRCVVVLEHVLPTPSKMYRETANVLLDRVFNAELNECPVSTTVDQAMDQLVAELEAEGARPYRIPIGGSSPIGALGYVNAAGELLEQATELDLDIAGIVTATGSGGTQAGLVVGLEASGSGIPVLGIGVGSDQPEQHRKVLTIAEATAELIGKPGIISGDDVTVNCGYIGDGYGIPTPAMNDALLLAARLEGLLFDPVYTGKALAGMIDLIRSGYFAEAENIVFLHTGGAVSLSAYADQLNT